MLRRAHKLREFIDQWLDDNQHRSSLKLNDVEWKQIEYLIQITYAYRQFCDVILKSKGITIHNVFAIYDRLFNHLEDTITKLWRKRTSWKLSMLFALEAAKRKLSDYYGKTYHERGDIYSSVAILSPKFKLAIFNIASWEKEWKLTY